MVDPSAYVVAGFGKAGSNDSESPMPNVTAGGIGLSEAEVAAVIAYLQDLAGAEITVEIPTDIDAEEGSKRDAVRARTGRDKQSQPRAPPRRYSTTRRGSSASTPAAPATRSPGRRGRSGPISRGSAPAGIEIAPAARHSRSQCGHHLKVFEAEHDARQ